MSTAKTTCECCGGEIEYCTVCDSETPVRCTRCFMTCYFPKGGNDWVRGAECPRNKPERTCAEIHSLKSTTPDLGQVLAEIDDFIASKLLIASGFSQMFDKQGSWLRIERGDKLVHVVIGRVIDHRDWSGNQISKSISEAAPTLIEVIAKIMPRLKELDL